MEVIWLVLIILFVIAETLTFNFITIWGAIGALSAFITAYFTDNITIQIVVFFLITSIALILSRTFVKKVIKFEKEATNLDSVIGKIATVLKEVDSDSGRVKVMGKDWAARSVDGNKIEEGSKVKVLEIKGVKLIVEECEKWFLL